MINALIGIKLGQSQQFNAAGKRIPVTQILAGPCTVTKIIDGGHYRSIQLSFGQTKNLNKSELGQMTKAGLSIKPRFLREFHSDETELKLGQEFKLADVFKVDEVVQITGISKGKGFAGVVKRHGFKGGSRTHGQSDRERAPGSIGMTTTPGRVFKGKRMAGRMGNETVTLRRSQIVAIDSGNNILTVKGLVPGGKNAILTIQKAK